MRCIDEMWERAVTSCYLQSNALCSLGTNRTRRLPGFDRPIGLLMIAVFPFAFRRRNPAGNVRRYASPTESAKPATAERACAVPPDR